MGVWVGGGDVIGILISCGFWIASGWPDGATAPMMVSLGFCLFAVQDAPAHSIRSFACWSIVGIAVVAIYLFAVLPRISNVEMLVAMLAPPFILFGILIARPATAFIGIALAITTATLLALQSSYSADFAAFINSSVSYVIGLTTAAVVTRLGRSVGAQSSARRLLRTNRVTLAVPADRPGRRDTTSLAALMLKPVALVLPPLDPLPLSSH